MFISNAYAQSAAPTGVEGLLAGPLPLIAIMVVMMYFVVFRPQQKKAKEAQAIMDALAKGDEVVTAGGILGKVVKVADSYVTLEVAANTEVVVQKHAVTLVLPKGTLKSL